MDSDGEPKHEDPMPAISKMMMIPMSPIFSCHAKKTTPLTLSFLVFFSEVGPFRFVVRFDARPVRE
jgi:hypothetical protein